MKNRKFYIPAEIEIVKAYSDVILASYQNEGIGDFADFSNWA